MDDFSVPVLVDAKAEYTKQIIDILKPHLYDGIRSIYKDSVELCEEHNQNDKILITFQNLLSNVPKWSQEIITNEYERIVHNSGCDWLEDLLTAVFISHTKILTAIRIGKQHKKINLKVPKIDHFIHRVYIQMAREFWKTPFLFDETISTTEYQRNMKYCEDIIINCIQETIRQQLPVKHILKEYLGQDLEEDDEIESFTDLDNKNIKKLVQKEIDTYNENENIQLENKENKEKVEEDLLSNINLETLENDKEQEGGSLKKENTSQIILENVENNKENKSEINLDTLEENNKDTENKNNQEDNTSIINLDTLGENKNTNDKQEDNTSVINLNTLEDNQNTKDKQEDNTSTINLDTIEDNQNTNNRQEENKSQNNLDTLEEINKQTLGKQEENISQINLETINTDLFKNVEQNKENNNNIDIKIEDNLLSNNSNDLLSNNSVDLLGNLNIPNINENVNFFETNNNDLDIVDVSFEDKKQEYEDNNNVSNQVLEEFEKLNNTQNIKYDNNYNFFSDAESEI